MKPSIAKGMRDMPPEQQIMRQDIISRLQTVFEMYGFSPLATPVVEKYDVLSSKYAGGTEILKETFKLQDQGKRKLGLRYDLTVPLARFVAMNPAMKLPFKRYQIDSVYRDGPLKLGRYREFFQCDVDTVGVDSALADAQCLQVAIAVFKELGIDVTITVNDISILKSLLTNVPEKQQTEAILILDKLKKIGKENVRKELEKAGIPADAITPVLEAAALKTNKEKFKTCKADRLKDVFDILKNDNVVFDPSMSRGLAYYTGIVFEAYANDSDVNVSLCGGGRYNNMIGNFVGRPDKYPAVGISFGLEPITDVLKKEEKKSVTEVFVIPIKVTKEASTLAETLREAGINTDIDLTGRSISKNLDYANQLNIPFVIILGEKELKEKVCTLKNMTSGKETKVPLADVAKTVQEQF